MTERYAIASVSSSDNSSSMSSTQKLVDSLFEENWSNVIEIIRAKPRLLRNRTLTRSFMNDGRTAQILPIHQACSMEFLPLDVLESLASAYPESLLKTETGLRRNCLQIAIRAGLHQDIIRFLLEKDPQAAIYQDSLGRVALHYACIKHDTYSIDLIQELVQACPATVCATDKMSHYTPLHLAASLCRSVDMIRLFISTSPQSVLMVSVKGLSPLDLALRTTEKSGSTSSHQREIVEILIGEEEKYRQLPLFSNFEKASQKKSNLSAVQQTSCFV